MEKIPNKFEVSVLVTPRSVAKLSPDQAATDIACALAEDLAAHLVYSFPIQITPTGNVYPDGQIDTRHTLSLFIFSEQQLNVYIEQQVKLALFTRAADNALNKLTDRRVN